MVNKKAQMSVVLNFVIYKLPIIITLAVFLNIVLKSYYNTGLNSHNIENKILVQRILYSEDLLAYKDKDTLRVYPGIVDLKKFSTEHLEEGIDLTKNNRVAANIELINLETKDLKKAYINEERARSWDDYVALEGFSSELFIKYVRIFDGGKFYPGVVRILILQRK